MVNGGVTAGGGEHSTSSPARPPAAGDGGALLHGERNALASDTGLSAHSRADVGTVVDDGAADTGSRSGRLGRVWGDGLIGGELFETFRERARGRVGDGGSDGVRHGCVYLDEGCEGLHISNHIAVNVMGLCANKVKNGNWTSVV